MAYVTESYYETTYYGIDAGADFNRLAARASDDVTLACPMQAKDSTGEALDLTEFDTEQLALLKKATCAQIEWYVQNGDDYNDGSLVGGYSIGSFSVQKNLTQHRPMGSLCPRAKGFLEQSGLMDRAVSVLGIGRRNSQDYLDE